jgi:hypothetical protein
MADVVKCKLDGFIAFHIQMSGHFKLKHPDVNYKENTEVLMNSNADLKRYGFRPNIDYYRAKLQGKDVTPFDFERKETTR